LRLVYYVALLKIKYAKNPFNISGVLEKMKEDDVKHMQKPATATTRNTFMNIMQQYT